LLESANFNEQMQQELQIQQWVSDKIENVFRQFFETITSNVTILVQKLA